MIAVAERLTSEETLDNREVLTVLWQRRWLIGACALLFTVAFTILAFLMTPIYRGQAVLVPASPDHTGLGSGLGSALDSVGGLAALAGINLGSREMEVEETLAVLKSRQFTEEFIQRNNLMPELFSKQWDAANNRWTGPLEKQPTLNRGFRAFDGIRNVNRDPKTGLITLQIDWRDRFKAVDWTTKMVQQLNQEMRTRAITEADASMGFLEKELAQTAEVSTREAISRLIEAQVKQRMLANVTQEYALRFVDRPLVPDVTDKVAPRKSLIMAGGMLLGIVVGMLASIIINAYKLASRRG